MLNTRRSDDSRKENKIQTPYEFVYVGNSIAENRIIYIESKSDHRFDILIYACTCTKNIEIKIIILILIFLSKISQIKYFHTYLNSKIVIYFNIYIYIYLSTFLKNIH